MMKLFVLAAVAAVALGAWSGDEKDAQVISNIVEIEPEGSYQSSYETENGISGQASGSLKAVPGTDSPALVVQGNFAYPNPEGGTIQVQYTADENGYQPQSDILPTPPPTQPVPPLIARALEYIAAHPQPVESRR